MAPKRPMTSKALRFAYDRYIGTDPAKAAAFEAELAEAQAPSSVGRLMEGVARCFPSEAAERLSAFCLDAETRARIDYLAGQANDGLLTDEERSEYGALVAALDFLALLPAKVRRNAEGASLRFCRQRRQNCLDAVETIPLPGSPHNAGSRWDSRPRRVSPGLSHGRQHFIGNRPTP